MAANTHATDAETLSELHERELLKRRGLSAKTAQALGIASRGTAIAFPYRHHGALLFTKMRLPPKRFWIEPQGARLCLWNLDCCRALASTGGTLIITEGEFDAASFVEAGFPCVVSVPNGANSHPREGDINPGEDTSFAYLWNDEKTGLIPDLEFANRIILATDSDPPGKTLAGELALRLGPDRCYLVQYPADCKDGNEVLVKHGVEALRRVVSEAIALVPNKLARYSEVPSITSAPGLTTGWAKLDAHLLLTFPELVIVTGKPGSGKSRWTLALVCQMCRLHNLRATYVSLEDNAARLKRHSMQYAIAWAGSERVDAHGEISVPIRFGGEEAWLDEHLFFVSPSASEEDTRDLEWLKGIIWEAACRHSCRIVVLDPWNELEHLWDRKGTTADEYINSALRELKRIMRRYGIILIIVAHPDKSAGRTEGMDDMTLYSISGGAAWKNKADGGVIIGRDEGTTRTIVKVDKRKDWDTMGKPGQIELAFNAATGIYTSC